MAPAAVLLDLLMATMNSIETWSVAAGDRDTGLAWRDAVTARMITAERYVDYHGLVRAAAAGLGLPGDAPTALHDAWEQMERWPDAAALEGLDVPYAFVTNCSTELGEVAVRRSGLRPAFTLSAEDAGWFKPRRPIYAEAAKRLGLASDAIRFVAGAPYDAVGASKAGLSTILVARRPLQERLPADIGVVESLEQALRP